jgi:molybdopterin-guanine dinucleotide biosynthesis protein
MAIIVVGGSNRGVGKTALVCGLIAALPEYRWAAVKIASHVPTQTASPDTDERGSGEPGPAGSFRQVFARRMNERFGSSNPAALPATNAVPAPVPASGLIWEESVAGEETDTGRYLAAGAERALLVTAVDGDLSDALNQLWPRFGRGSNIIFESNSVAHHVSADACVLIHAVAERALPLPARKPSFLAALRHADALVAHAAVDKVIPEGLCLAGGDQAQPSPRPIFHLQTLEQISPEMLAWLRRRLPEPLHF